MLLIEVPFFDAIVYSKSAIVLVHSVAEPPLFWAAPAPTPGRQGPGADSGSDLRGSAPAPG